LFAATFLEYFEQKNDDMLTFLMMNPRVAMAGGVKCFKEIAFVAGAHPLKEESANFTTDFFKELVILPGSSNL